MTLRDFLVILRVRWFTVLACALVVLGITAVLLATQTPTYTAQARFYLSATAPKGDSANSGTYVITSKDLNTYIAVLGSPAVIDPLRKTLGLPPGAPIDVSAQVPEGASILEVTATSSDPKLAADIANAVGPQLAAVAGEFSTLLANAGQSVKATTISPAVTPGSPTSPKVKQNLLLGLLVGLVLGVGLAFIRHMLDTKVRGEDDVKALSAAPVLGSLPLDRVSVDGLVSLENDPHGHHAEAVRRLRTNLMFVDVTTGGHSFVITSSVPGEGKTTTAVNLALAMADAGSRVLLLDADLRNPSVAKTMGLEGSVGLTTVLLGQAAPEDVVQRWRLTDLYVLPAGQVPPNPSELLGSEPMEALFAKLVHDYDFVLVDSPPVVPVVDAVLVNRLTRGLLMVIGVDRTKKRDLASGLKSLETVGVDVSGFALNMIPGKGGDAYRYGYYGYEPEGSERSRSRHRKRDKRRNAAPVG